MEVSLGEMVNCVYVNNKEGQRFSHWIEIESNKLAPPGSMSQNERENFHSFLVELSKYILRPQQQ